MNHDIRIEQHAEVPLVVVRRRASISQLSQVVPQACGAVWKIIREQQIPNPGRNVAVYLDEEINLEVGVELTTPIAGSGELIGSKLPAGTVATTTHCGPYPQLILAHEALHRWCRQHGYQLAGPSWELYGHWQEAWNTDPSQIRTDIYYLLK